MGSDPDIPQNEHITSKNCDTILPGQKICLPPASILSCMQLEDAGVTCTPSRADFDADLLSRIPAEAQVCVQTMRQSNPTASTEFLIATSKALADEVPLTSAAYLTNCQQIFSNPNEKSLPFEDNHFDHIELDADGKLVTVDYWGTEDN